MLIQKGVSFNNTKLRLKIRCWKFEVLKLEKSRFSGFRFIMANFAQNIQQMETSQGIYIGELRTEAIHVRSGQKIITDAPPDNQGKGEAFSPTDLLAASLGSCML